MATDTPYKVPRGEDSIHIYVHHCMGAKGIIINIPGYKGSIEGYKNKYVTLANHLAQQKVASVVRMPNTLRLGSEYRPGLIADVRAVIARTLWLSECIAGVRHPEIYLMGFSMGGYAAAVVASEFTQIKKILLMEPATVGTYLTGKLPTETLAKFTGEVYIVMGEGGVGREGGTKYLDALTGASKRVMEVIPNCDHQFQGTLNGQILAKAPLWAFAGDTTFPSPDGGLILY